MTNFHLIARGGVELAGPPEYARADQDDAWALFKAVSEASVTSTNSAHDMVDHLVSKSTQGLIGASWVETELRNHFTQLVRKFRTAWAAHARSLAGTTDPTPPTLLKEPDRLPEHLVPGQRKEVVDPQTGELITVIVPVEAPSGPEPVKTDTVAVQINAALQHCYTRQQENNRIIATIAGLDVMAEARIKARETRAESRRALRENIRVAKYAELIDLAKAARPKYPEDTSVEEILRGEEIDIKAFGLSYRKLREFLVGLSCGAPA
ncbi:hypothetical protein ACN2WE_40855 [Streptomyces sp. cg28]|uniref:hypothetical protein n=1 Tax=Streptomyces sp. cg28 TaxID=3403457 RepID=UPI003B226198